jgi:biotin carboxyl carrier protein
MALVTDVNGNPNNNVDVLYDIVSGSGIMGADTVATDQDGQAVVTFTGSEPGVATIKGTVMSRVPTDEEVSAAEGALFLYGLDEDPGELEVIKWLAKPGDEVTRGQSLVILEDRQDNKYTVTAPRDGILSVFMAEEKDDVEYGDTLVYVIEAAE